jgi:hypothetical protein
LHSCCCCCCRCCCRCCWLLLLLRRNLQVRHALHHICYTLPLLLLLLLWRRQLPLLQQQPWCNLLQHLLHRLCQVGRYPLLKHVEHCFQPCRHLLPLNQCPLLLLLLLLILLLLLLLLLLSIQVLVKLVEEVRRKHLHPTQECSQRCVSACRVI